jgi:hypothetical protein
MKAAFMRFMIKDAGNVQLLYWAVKSAQELNVDSQYALWEYFISNLPADIKEKAGRRLNAPRSAQPHLSMARELNLLELRGRWLVTAHGRAFLELWERDKHNPPRFFLLMLLLNYDRSFLIPFFKRMLDSGKSPEKLTYKEAVPMAKDAWKELWKNCWHELSSIEPPIPRPEEISTHTCYHHAAARLRFVVGQEGLGLRKDQLLKLLENFSDCAFRELPDHFCFLLGHAISGRMPEPVDMEELKERLKDAFLRLKGLAYASARATFYYVNEILLPQKAVEWREFSSFLRSSKGISVQPSFSSDDFIFSIKGVI